MRICPVLFFSLVLLYLLPSVTIWESRVVSLQQSRSVGKPCEEARHTIAVATEVPFSTNASKPSKSISQSAGSSIVESEECPSAPHVLFIYRTMHPSAKGYSQWVMNTIGVLQSIPVLLCIMRESSTPAPTAFTLAVVLHDYFVPWLSRFRAGFAGPVFLGPFVFGKTVNGTLSNTTFMAETYRLASEAAKRASLKAFNVTVAALPQGVNTDQLKPILARGARKVPIIQFKFHSHITINETQVIDMVNAAGVSGYRVLTSSHQGLAFPQRVYFEALEHAPWMVTFTPSETFGAFIQEAKAFDVPIFLITQWKNEWFVDGVDGMYAPSDASWPLMRERFARFLRALHTYAPRSSVLSSLSYEVCGARWRPFLPPELL